MPEDSQHYYNEYLGRLTVVLLRNNHYIFGYLKSYDQYHSISINDAVERIFHENQYAERFHGLIILRAENILFVGRINEFSPGALAVADFNMLLKKINEVKNTEGNIFPAV